MSNILVTRSLPPEILEPLGELGAVSIWPVDLPMPRDDLLGSVAGARALLSMLTDRIDRTVLETAQGLEVVSQMAVGVDNIDLDACFRRGVRMATLPVSSPTPWPTPLSL